MDRQSFIQFRSLSLNDLVTMHGISAINPGYWRTAQGVRYFANQAQAIRAGLSLRRMLVLRQDEISSSVDIVRQQLDAAVDLSIVIYEQVEPDDQFWLTLDSFILTDKAGVRGVLSFKTRTEGHQFTNEEAKVRELERILENFRAYEHSPESLYPGISG